MSDVLDRLAADILKDLQGENVPLTQKLEAFKILSAREAAAAKKPGQPGRPRREEPEPEEDDEAENFPTFRSMAAQIRKHS